VCGHYGKKLTDVNKELAITLLRQGVSQYKIASLCGVSHTTIFFLSWEIRGKRDWLKYRAEHKLQPQEVLRKEDIEEYEQGQKQKREERSSWRIAKREYLAVKAWLHTNAPCR
jgi:predicted transcriptional regulator